MYLFIITYNEKFYFVNPPFYAFFDDFIVLISVSE